MTCIRENLSNFVEEDGLSVKYGDNSIVKTKGYGVVKARNVKITKVAYVVGLKHNLLSASQICDDESKIKIRRKCVVIYDPKGKPILLAKRESGVYLLDLISAEEDTYTCFYSQFEPELS